LATQNAVAECDNPQAPQPPSDTARTTADEDPDVSRVASADSYAVAASTTVA
jgi:hypothetical protein